MKKNIMRRIGAAFLGLGIVLGAFGMQAESKAQAKEVKKEPNFTVTGKQVDDKITVTLKNDETDGTWFDRAAVFVPENTKLIYKDLNEVATLASGDSVDFTVYIRGKNEEYDPEKPTAFREGLIPEGKEQVKEPGDAEHPQGTEAGKDDVAKTGAGSGMLVASLLLIGTGLTLLVVNLEAKKRKGFLAFVLAAGLVLPATSVLKAEEKEEDNRIYYYHEDTYKYDGIEETVTFLIRFGAFKPEEGEEAPKSFRTEVFKLDDEIIVSYEAADEPIGYRETIQEGRKGGCSSFKYLDGSSGSKFFFVGQPTIIAVGAIEELPETTLKAKTIYRRAEAKPENALGNESITVQEGQDVTTKAKVKYQVDPKTGELIKDNPEILSADKMPTDKIVEVPTYTESEPTVIPFETERRENAELAPGEEQVIQAGENGESVNKGYYDVDPETGEVLKGTFIVTETVTVKEPVNEIIEYGPKEETEEPVDPEEGEGEATEPEEGEGEVTEPEEGEGGTGVDPAEGEGETTDPEEGEGGADADPAEGEGSEVEEP